MDIGTALRGLAGNPHLLALRPTGQVLQLTDRQMVMSLRGGNRRRYTGTFSDLVAIDWQVMTGAEFAKLINNAAASGGDT